MTNVQLSFKISPSSHISKIYTVYIIKYNGAPGGKIVKRKVAERILVHVI